MTDLENKQEIQDLKNRVDVVEKRFDKIDMNIEKIWEKIDLNRDSQIRNQTILEQMQKEMSNMNNNVITISERMAESNRIFSEKLTESYKETSEKFSKVYKHINENKEKSQGKWEKFWSKLAWTFVGFLFSILLFILRNPIN